MSLRNRIFIIFTLLLTIPFIMLSLIIPNQLTNIFEEQTKTSTLDMMEQYSYHIDNITSQAEDLAKQALITPTTQQWLRIENEHGNEQSSQQWLMRNELRGQFSSMVLNNSHGMSIFAYLDNNEGIWSSYPSLEDTEWYNAFNEHNQRWVGSHIDTTFSHIEPTNSYLMPLVDIDTLESSGILKINLPSSIFQDALNKIKLGEEGRVYLLNSYGENVLLGDTETPDHVLKEGLNSITNANVENGLIETSYEGEEYLVFYQRLTVGDWILFSEITKSELFHRINDLQNNLLMISGVIFIITLFTSYVLSTNIVRPLGKLVKTMGFIEVGDFKGAKQVMPPADSHTHEIGYLVKSVNHTIDKLNQLIKFEYEANIRRKDAEYKALLLQINPHFMNNTLEIIGGLAAQGKNKEVMDVSVYLGRMMRYSLNTQSDIVTLGEEIAYIRNFTEILKLRYEDAISVDIDEEIECKNLPIIKFIIQPLVENAVKYSFIEKSIVEITIRTEKVRDKVIITIEDNGVGMSEEVISELESIGINGESNNVLDSEGRSIGLKNVIGRLRLFYGSKFSYHIQSEKNSGTKVKLCIAVGGTTDV